jgi:hypothetical protein
MKGRKKFIDKTSTRDEEVRPHKSQCNADQNFKHLGGFSRPFRRLLSGFN